MKLIVRPKLGKCKTKIKIRGFIDAEIWANEQKLKEVLAIEKHAALTAQVAELKKRRAEILAEIEKKARERIQ